MKKKQIHSLFWLLTAAITKAVHGQISNALVHYNTTCQNNITANQFLTQVNKTQGDWSETCCSLSANQEGVMLEVQQAVTNGSVPNPAYYFAPQDNITIVNYFNEYSVNWRVIKHALAAVFMVGDDNPFARSTPQLTNLTKKLAQQWVSAWKTKTGETLPLVQLSSSAIKTQKAPFSCLSPTDDVCQQLIAKLNKQFDQLSDIFLSIIFHQEEITTPSMRSWSSLNKNRIPKPSSNLSIFNAPWYTPNGAPQSGVIASKGVIGKKISVNCLFPLNANTDQRKRDYGNPCGSAVLAMD